MFLSVTNEMICACHSGNICEFCVRRHFPFLFSELGTRTFASIEFNHKCNILELDHHASKLSPVFPYICLLFGFACKKFKRLYINCFFPCGEVKAGLTF